MRLFSDRGRAELHNFARKIGLDIVKDYRPAGYYVLVRRETWKLALQHGALPQSSNILDKLLIGGTRPWA